MIKNLNNTIIEVFDMDYLYCGYKLSNEYDYYLVLKIPTVKGYCKFKNINEAKSSIGIKIFELKSKSDIVLSSKSFAGSNIVDYNKFKYKLTDTVKYANRKYSLVGYCFNNYAQMELVNPFLVDFSSISKYVSSLFGSKLSIKEIENLSNEFLIEGRFDDDMLIPFVNVKQESEDLKKIDEGPTDDEIVKHLSFKFDKTIYKLKKDIFIDAFKSNTNLLLEINAKNETVYNEVLDVALGINSLINDKIENGFGTKKTKTIKKKKVKTKQDVDSLEFDIENLIL